MFCAVRADSYQLCPKTRRSVWSEVAFQKLPTEKVEEIIKSWETIYDKEDIEPKATCPEIITNSVSQRATGGAKEGVEEQEHKYSKPPPKPIQGTDLGKEKLRQMLKPQQKPTKLGIMMKKDRK